MDQRSTGELNWRVHPARQHPRKTVAAIVIILAFCLVVMVSFSSLGLALFSGLVLFLSLIRFFLPTSYTLTETHVKWVFMGIAQKRPWSNYMRVDKVRGGVFLSPFLQTNRLDHFRGKFLLCGKERSEVFEFAEKHISKEPRESS